MRKCTCKCSAVVERYYSAITFEAGAPLKRERLSCGSALVNVAPLQLERNYSAITFEAGAPLKRERRSECSVFEAGAPL